eukprot:TRINITY_DN5828_c0_g1_i2.p1 TRINITY_DN5828_c0_g1~~TRINITY_DN5828_c0_g1_i2.p1  ORF type:complete len:498 (-),score=58.61 TRINITY_DN5828_c0_g1_i2:1370-2863(-)
MSVVNSYDRPNKKVEKIIRDSIHEYVTLAQETVKVLDTLPVQRQRNLFQLGCVQYVFPCASHKRFEHALGVAELGRKVMGKISSNQPELDVRNTDKLLVQIAGLCHDLGHGPLSHAYESKFLKQVPNGKRKFEDWTHEAMSCRFVEYIFDHISQTSRYDFFEERENMKRIQDLIIGDGSRCDWSGRKWMLDIISNDRNGVDVDKWDYLTRDSRMCNVSPDFKHSPLLEGLRAFGDNYGICYRESCRPSIKNLMNCREAMHEQIYYHRKCKAIEAMFVDAMVFADEDYGFSKAALDIEEYLHLDDYLFGPIKIDKRQTPGIVSAQQLLKRIAYRDLYIFCSDVVLSQQQREVVQNYSERDFQEEIVSFQCSNEIGLQFKPEDIYVLKVDINQGKTDMLKKVYFFEDENDNPFNFNVHEVLHGEKQVTKTKIYVFLKKQIPQEEKSKWKTLVKDAFTKWKEEKLGKCGKVCSPVKRQCCRESASSQELGTSAVRQIKFE